jgi:putative redox protein
MSSVADQIKIDVYQISEATSEAAIREHRIHFDRPLAKGGTDGGPMGGEAFLASVAGCFLSNLLAASRARDAAVSGVRVQVTGTIDGPPSRFVGLELAVSANVVDRQVMEKLVDIAARGCIMVNTLRDKMDLSIRVV